MDVATETTDSIYHFKSTPTKLLAASNNKIYTLNQTQIISLDMASNQVSVLIDRDNSIEAFQPVGNLIQASNDKIYGVTKYGGAFGSGTIFEYDPNTQSKTTLAEFNDTLVGSFPLTSLVEGASGKLYGAASLNAEGLSGLIYEYDFVKDTLKPLLDLDTSGYYLYSIPTMNMIKADNDKLYGIVEGFRTECIFEFDPQLNQFTVKKCFGSGNSLPGHILTASNGNLFFTTTGGGKNGEGGIYEYDPIIDSLELKYDFPRFPQNYMKAGRELVEIDSNRILGYIIRGGVNRKGVLFEYNISLETLVEVFDFDSTASNSVVYMKKTDDDLIVGYTQPNSFYKRKGEIFEYNPNSKVYTAKYQLKKVEENMGPLIELASNTVTEIKKSIRINQQARIWPNPVKNDLSIQLRSTSKLDIRIFSIDGKVVYENKNNIGSGFIIDFDFPVGTYVLVLENEDFIETHKIVKVD